ncbi:DUF1770-domain-containing protein [Zalerion maritima]|uniref:DUF1770-domain-containing protein n=1 Tax=Zalerion maritima TaxID=339359 RepID=A0AAD5WSF5_9PEZI|nr:DUF1770-domain-containing protein [Zalerion maritima]
MSSSIPLQVAETVQTASINRNPSANHDVNPSTAAARKIPANVVSEKYPGSDFEGSEYGVVKPRPRPSHMAYPLPDLRFEQSYLKSIEKADTWGKVAWVTFKDMMLMPFLQGVVYNIALCGFKHWNKRARVSGNTIGARVRRWWYGVNNWPIRK